MMARVRQTKLQKATEVKKTKTVKPYHIRLKLSAEQSEKIVKKVIHEYNGILQEKKAATAGLQVNDAVDFRFKEAQKIYDGKVDYTDFPFEDCSNVAGIIIPAAVDGARAQILRAFAINPPFKVQNEIEPDIAQKKEQLLQVIIRDRIPGAGTEFSAWFQNALLKGVGILKHYEKKIENKQITKKSYTNIEDFVKVHDIEKYPDIVERLLAGETVSLMESSPEVEYDGSIIEWVASENFLIRKKEKNTNTADFVGEIIEYTAEKLLEQDFDNINELISDEERDDAFVSNTVFKTVHCEVKIDLKGNGEKEKLFAVVEIEKEKLLLVERCDKNYSIYIPMFVSPYQGNFWRRGFYDKLISVHDTHKNIIDIILNSAYISFIPSFKANKKGSFDPQEQSWYPGVVWWLDAMDDVVQWDIRPSRMPFSEWADRMEKYGYELTGISPYTQGTPVSSQESGRKIQTLLAAGGIRIEENVIYIKEALNELARQIVDRLKDKQREIVFIEGEPTDIDPAIFSGSKNAYISTFDIANMNPDAILERNLLVLNTESKNPLVANNLDAIRELHIPFLKAAGMGWEDRIEKILPSPEELLKKQTEIQKQALKELYMEQAGAIESGMTPPPLGGV